jgi:putative glutamine amidotransferase
VRRPVVGITTYLEQARWTIWDQQAALLPQSYVDAVARAGGVPVLLPPAAGRAAEAIAAVDALVLAGGADVDPKHYGEEPHPLTVSRPDRDDWELGLLKAALARRRPVLAVCRGMQLLNVACGGTLHQHLPDVVHNDDHLPEPGTFGVNQIRVTPASRLARILGRRAVVSCHHHQSVHVLGDGLGPAAWSVDETIEAIEHFQHEFVVGVQWHPEEAPRDGRLFTALVHAATHPSVPALPAGPAKKPAKVNGAIEVRRPATKKKDKDKA